MARSKFCWLVVYETGNMQFVKAQTIWQILECGQLNEDTDSIINITKMGFSDSYSYESAIDIPFRD